MFDKLYESMEAEVGRIVAVIYTALWYAAIATAILVVIMQLIKTV